MANELTYILGAGASFESMPVVKSFPYRFEEFSQYVTSLRGIPHIFINNRDFITTLENKAKELSRQFKTHQSFDTYFKKLFHTEQTAEIFISKKVLNLYFLWEHISETRDKPQNYSEAVFWKKSIIDKRYDALIAGLLKPIGGKKETYCPVNFITWNYDLNLFLSLKNYFYPHETLGKFLEYIRKEGQENIWEIGRQIKVINMNGYFYSSSLSNEKSLPIINQETFNLLLKKSTDQHFSINFTDSDSELIKFAWESNLGVGEKARDMIKESKNVVVVGYTFPLYNRLIDLSYLNLDNFSNCSLAIQDPNAENLKQDFLNMGGPRDSLSIKPITNCESFYIPPTIFDSTDYIGEWLKQMN